MNQIINKINLLKSLYEQYYSIMSDYPYKNINFSKENITSLLTSNSFNSLFNRMMITNLKILESIKNKQNFKQQFDQFRIKNINSIKDKINRYYQNESIKGKVCFNKCLNDLMGFRLLIDDDLNELLSELNHLYAHDQKIKVLSKINGNSSYKAIHIYIKLNNHCLPWELQIWNIKDKINNDLSHYEKYGRY